MTATLRGISVDGREASFDSNGQATYTVVYKVTTDDKNDGATQVNLASGLPAIGDLYTAGNDFDPNAVVIDKQPRQLDGSPNEWEVDVTASTDVDQNPVLTIDNPLLIPPVLSYGFTHRRILVAGRFSDPLNPASAFDASVLAPNLEPFVPQPEMDIAEPTLQIQVNRAALPDILAIQNSVNATSFQGALARQLRLTATARNQWHKSVGNYWEIVYVFHYKWETWDVQIQNQGTYYWNGGLPTNPASTTADKDRKVKKVDGRPVIVNLTTAGDINTTTTPTYTVLRVYREIDFNTLGII